MNLDATPTNTTRNKSFPKDTTKIDSNPRRIERTRNYSVFNPKTLAQESMEISKFLCPLPSVDNGVYIAPPPKTPTVD
ncbi:hypothetical protein COLO4_05353 [Corchorus olitorius]|uniref:Uncharacterized protein n=1 Tax=Corchorus olitorius TaxID=93759 RepID=A0A1R3KR68_9ROSI|nr:hypothetical protein COLO4_05353 [Corchorus olitorius]